ncbi:Na+/H+ antiporter subunit E [Maricaulis sp.]|uniref:Na+/H+ antiporter subunit E n=1 Tax=Maricaulis sp. TaxID=1486257 RepID=UPI0026252BFE|nr:Na+/H+ antiporter subunit E [Maricaulis sp.]
MVYGLGLTAVLVVLWLVLSGSYTLSGDHSILLVMTVVSLAATVGLAVRMRILDRETVPLAPLLPLLTYWSWLGREIVAANIAVIRLIMKPDVDIEPRLVRVPVDLRSGLARCVFANSITLTPGTVTVDIENDGFLVHALDNSFTAPEGFAEMALRTDIASDGKREEA